MSSRDAIIATTVVYSCWCVSRRRLSTRDAPPAKIVKKKKGFGMFSPSKAEERGSVSVDMADAYDTSKTIGGTNPLRKKP